MNIFGQKCLHPLVIFVLILTVMVWPAGAAAGMQPQSRVDAYGLVVEDGEFIYVVGDAVNFSGQLPAGSLDLGGGMLDLWVAKLRRDGTPVFQALIGGKADDIASGVTVRQGVIYITGETWSTDFPGAPGSAGENDALVLALAADGGSVLWARRFGGSDQDAGRAVALRGSELYLTGITWSPDFQPGSAKGDADGFLARLDLSGGLQWLKVFGGRGLDAPFGLAAGNAGIWVTGETFSPNLAGAPLGSGDIFALRYNDAGQQQFAGLYGGPGEDIAYAAALAPDGSLYLTGSTQSGSLPGAKGQFGGATDGFLMRIAADGKLQSTRYLGGPEDDAGMALAVLPDGSALAAGRTRSADFPSGESLTALSLGGQDAFLAQVNPAGELLYASRQGGAGDDYVSGMGIMSSALALAGNFQEEAAPYLLLVPSADLPEITLPTSVPPLPTATLAVTATAQPTETQGPTITPQPTEAFVSDEPLAQAETAAPAVEIAPTEGLAAQPAQAEVTSPAATASPTAPVPVQAEPTQVLAQQQAAEKPAGLPGGWIASGLALIAGLLGGMYWLRRKQHAEKL